MLAPIKLCSVASLFLFAMPAEAVVAFNFTYDNTTQWGADDSSPQRQAMNKAASMISSYLSGYTATINFSVSSINEANNTLASAGSYIAPQAGFTNLGVVGTNITQGTNYGPTQGQITVNFGANWSFSDTVSNTEYDFTHVMMHELGHALGFFSLISYEGVGELSGHPTTFSAYDDFLVDAAGNDLVDHDSYTTGANWLAARESGIFFSGTNAMIANGGNLVPLYAPSTWLDGSSASHLDTDTYTGSNQKMMNHAVGTGLGNRSFSPLEIAIFKDIGYTSFAAPVPEPASNLIILISTSLLLTCRRRTRRAD